MLKRLRMPSPAFVLSIVAVFAALTGGAFAASKITSAKIKNGTIQGIDVKDNNLKAADVSGLGGADVTDDSLKGADIDESSLNLVESESAQVTTACAVARQIPSGSGITSADPNGGTEGQCDVTFSHDVTACAYQVSLARDANAGPLNGEIAVEPAATANTLRVYGFLSAGGVDDRPFAVTVFC